jgi:phage portal protein BeeE
MALWPITLFMGRSPPETVPVAVVGTENQSVALDRMSDQMLREYTRSIYLWRCVDMIGQMASSVPLSVEPESDRELTKEEQQVAALLQRPNPQWTGPAIQYFIAACLAVANKAYLLRVRGVSQVTLEMWPLLPNEVVINYGKGSRVIESFTVTTANGQGTTVDPKKYPVDAETGDCDVMYIHRPALNWQTDKSPAAVAMPPAEVFTRVLQRCADIVSNASNITGLLSTETEMTKTALQEIKDKLNQFKTGSKDSGGTVVAANAKWSLTRLSEDPASALSVEIKDSLARDVCMTFGVPTQLVGLPGTDTYNNLALARVGFLTDTVLPGYVNLYLAAATQQLLRDTKSVIAPDLETLPAMVAARNSMMEIAVKATMLSVNEQRALIGYPPFNGENADTPVLLEELALKRLAIEAQGGNARNILDKQPT